MHCLPFTREKKNNTKLNNTAASRYHLHPWTRRRHPRNFTKASGCPRTSSPLHATTESGIILINGTSSLVLSGVNVLSHSRLAEGDSSVLPEHPNQIAVGAACLNRWNNGSRHSSQRQLDYCTPTSPHKKKFKMPQHSPGTVSRQMDPIICVDKTVMALSLQVWDSW